METTTNNPVKVTPTEEVMVSIERITTLLKTRTAILKDRVDGSDLSPVSPEEREEPKGILWRLKFIENILDESLHNLNESLDLL